MAFLRAVFGEDRRPTFVPFIYKSRALVPGPELEQDFAIYEQLVIRCLYMPPTSTMLLFGGELGEELFLRRAETRSSWIAFQEAFLMRYPHFRIRLEKASAAMSELAVPYKNNGRRQPSFPQILFGCALLAMLPRTVRLRAEAPLSNGSCQCRCDLELSSKDGGRILRYEVCGMLSREHGVKQH